jgi:hypothetical protein
MCLLFLPRELLFQYNFEIIHRNNSETRLFSLVTKLQKDVLGHTNDPFYTFIDYLEGCLCSFRLHPEPPDHDFRQEVMSRPTVHHRYH